MDKNKQFTEHAHPIGAVVEPASGVATAVGKDKKTKSNLSEILKSADLTSDFDESIDPDAHQPESKVVTPPISPESSFDSSVKIAPLEAMSSTGVSSKKEKIKAIVKKRPVWISIVAIGLPFLVLTGMMLGLHFLNKAPQMVNDNTDIDKATLLIDSNKKTVGVKTGTEPDGLEIGATVSTSSQGSANIRLGLVNGTDPSILFEDGKANSWQVLGAGGSLQFVQGADTRLKLDSNALSLTNALNVGGETNANGGLNVKGNSNLGDNSANVLTIQGNKASLPNGLSFDDNTLSINAASNTVAVGTAASASFKLLVAGSFKATGNIFSDGQVLAFAGSAKGPSFAFSGNPNSGIFQPSANIVAVSAGGSEVLRVQSGAVIAVGSNLEADGFIRAGRGGSNPGFQIARFTGTLDGSGSAVVGTGVSSLYARALTIQAFYRGNSNEALAMNIDYANGGSLQISGGIPGRQFRATLIYSQDNAGW